MRRSRDLDDPETHALRRSRDANPSDGLWAVPVEQAVSERDAILTVAEDSDQARWIPRGRDAMEVLYRRRCAVDAERAFVTAADLADWLDEAGYTGDRRRLAPVFVGRGASWVCVGRVPHPRRHATLTPCWALRGE